MARSRAGRHARRATPSTSRSSSSTASTPSCSTTELAQFDLKRLAPRSTPDRDLQFGYLGLQTLYDRYFLHVAAARRIELPQAFFMRVAMGLALNEVDREARAIEFYNVLSTLRLHELDARRCSTPARTARSCRRAT